jgi:putative colanic acid biosynthesis UDP-glucose lipid carrier transferase
MLLNSTLYVKNQHQFLSYLLVSWVIISVVNKFYHIKRIANLIQITSSILRQFFSFIIVIYAYLGYFKQYYISRPELFRFFIKIFVLIALFKIIIYFLLIKYREYIGGNYRNVIIIGDNKNTNQLTCIFKARKEFGYSYKAKFNTNADDFSLDNCFT